MIRPLLKYCGNHTFQDYQLAVNSNSDFIGFIFFEGSKRYAKPETVKEWIVRNPKKVKQKTVGVFVNPTINDIDNVITHVDLDIIQLHGSESPNFVKEVGRYIKRPIWKAIHHGDDAPTTMNAFNGSANGYVIDVKTKEAWGGTGRSFNWKAIPLYKREAEKQGVPCLIAGGINPGNITNLLNYKPYGIDLASGIEVNGVKSKQLIDELERKVVHYHG